MWRTRFARAGGALAIGWACGEGAAVGQVTYRTVALTGEPAPGTEPGVVFDSFTISSEGSWRPLNVGGKIAFRGELAGPGIDGSNNIGVWSEGRGPLSLIARLDDAPPGGTGHNFTDLYSVMVSDDGDSSFQGLFYGIGSGVWSNAGGGLEMLAITGSAAPGTEPGVVFDSVVGPRYTNGRLIVSGELTGGGVATGTRGLWIEQNGALSLLARTGDQARGLAAGVIYSSFPLLGVTGADEVILGARVTGPGLEAPRDFGFWVNDFSGLHLAVHPSNAVPGAPAGVGYSRVPSFVVNEVGHVAFKGILSGPGIDVTNHSGIWSGPLGFLVEVARMGLPAPGMPAAAVYSAFGEPLSMNRNSEVAFLATAAGAGVDASNDGGIWIWCGGSPSLQTREGEQVPDTAGAVFSRFFSAQLDDTGGVVVGAVIAGAGIDASNNIGIWLARAGGSLEQIARTGTLFDVNDDPVLEDLRTMRYLFLLPRHNSSGQTAFVADFVDGSSGVFVATLDSPCLCEFDGYAPQVDVFDLLAYLDAWFAGATQAELDGRAGVDVFDLLVYLDCWFGASTGEDCA